ncbi:MAG: hypothetical protein R6U98_26410 [Pirellulaceae bacterium]
MSSLAHLCAARFLYLADSFLTERSPLDAIHCAELAVKSVSLCGISLGR